MVTAPTETLMLALSAALTGVLWMPLIANRLIELGPWRALKNPEPDSHPRARWAFRLAAAHRNAIENLVVFTPLVLLVITGGLGSSLTATACSVFLFARLAHALVYTLGIPVLRTVAFAVGFACQAVLLLRVLGFV